MARIVTVGGSIGGLATALVLSARGHDVTVLERDADPVPAGPHEAWHGWPRRGVPHLRGTHVFNARGLHVLRDHLPNVLTELERAGARQVPVPGSAPDGTAAFNRLVCRRTTYEMALRTVALRQPSIRFEPATTVVELLGGARVAPAIPHVVGVRTSDGRAFPADLVVDTSGRTSAVARWLAAVGAVVPPPDSRPSGMSVNTRWYRLRDPDADPGLVVTDLGYGGCVLFPADDGMFSVTFGVFGADPVFRGLRDQERFHAAAAAVPAVAPWVAADVAEPDGGIRFLGALPNRLRRLTANGRPVASGVVCLGDAAVSTNPRFGRGVGLALVHAVCLADALERHDNPVALATAFARATETELEPWFHDAAAGDVVGATIARRVRAGEPLGSIGADGDDPRIRLARATPFAVQRDPLVRTAFHRTWNLLEPPEAFAGDPEVRSRVEAVWRELDRDPPPPAAPTYSDMTRILSR